MKACLLSVEGVSNVEPQAAGQDGSPPEVAAASSTGVAGIGTIVAIVVGALNVLLVVAMTTFFIRRRRQQQQVRAESSFSSGSSEAGNRSGLRSVGSTVRSFSSFASKFGGSQFSSADDNSVASLE